MGQQSTQSFPSLYQPAVAIRIETNPFTTAENSLIAANLDAAMASAAEIANLKVRIRALNATHINLKRRVKDLEAMLASSDGTLPQLE